MTDPRRFAPLFDRLPDDVPALVEAVRGLAIDPVVGPRRYGRSVSPETADERLPTVVEMVAAVLERSDLPLQVPRGPGRRLVVLCRIPAVLLVAMLRHKGVPARARVGFARYLPVEHGVPFHFVTEFWSRDHARWVAVDAAIDGRLLHARRARLASADPSRAGDHRQRSLRADEFAAAGAAWRSCRSGAADPFDFLRRRRRALRTLGVAVLHDLVALNKAELPTHHTPEPFAGGEDEEITSGEIGAVDRAASALEGVDERFAEMRRFYEESEWGRAVQDRLGALVAGRSQGEDHDR